MPARIGQGQRDSPGVEQTGPDPGRELSEICRIGIEKAIADRKIAVSCPVNGTYQPLFGDTALERFRQVPSGGTLSLPENKEAVGAVMASDKNADKKFIINAISTDGGIVPRNILLAQGLALVDAGVLQLNDFLQKIGTAPAAMPGLEKRKGALQIDMDSVLGQPPLKIFRRGELLMSDNQEQYTGNTAFGKHYFLRQRKADLMIFQKKINLEVVIPFGRHYISGKMYLLMQYRAKSGPQIYSVRR